LLHLALVAPEACEAHGGAEFPGFRLLLAGDRESALEIGFRFRSTRHPFRERLDGCAEWDNKAVAIASYARQADDLELENFARRIRLRATRRMGELLKQYDARGGDHSKDREVLKFDDPARRSRAAVAAQANISRHKTNMAVSIANIPEDDFQKVVESNHPPGANLLAQLSKRRPYERVHAVTKSSLDEVLKSASATSAIEGLLKFEAGAAGCDMDAIVEILTQRGRWKTLQRVRRAIGLVFRLNSALDEAGGRGNSMLRPEEST
jgi:hypothetical protein